MTTVGSSPAANRRSASRRRAGPGVAPGKVTSVVPGTHPGEMGAQRVVVTPGHRPSGPPHRGEACDEVPPAPPPLELHAPMRPAQPHRYPMGQMVTGPHPLTGPGADRAHRRLPDPWTLVMTRRHRPDHPILSVTPHARSVSIRPPGCAGVHSNDSGASSALAALTKARVGPTLRSARSERPALLRGPASSEDAPGTAGRVRARGTGVRDPRVREIGCDDGQRSEASWLGVVARPEGPAVDGRRRAEVGRHSTATPGDTWQCRRRERPQK